MKTCSFVYLLLSLGREEIEHSLKGKFVKLFSSLSPTPPQPMTRLGEQAKPLTLLPLLLLHFPIEEEFNALKQ